MTIHGKDKTILAKPSASNTFCKFAGVLRNSKHASFNLGHSCCSARARMPATMLTAIHTLTRFDKSISSPGYQSICCYKQELQPHCFFVDFSSASLFLFFLHAICLHLGCWICRRSRRTIWLDMWTLPLEGRCRSRSTLMERDGLLDSPWRQGLRTRGLYLEYSEMYGRLAEWIFLLATVQSRPVRSIARAFDPSVLFASRSHPFLFVFLLFFVFLQWFLCFFFVFSLILLFSIGFLRLFGSTWFFSFIPPSVFLGSFLFFRFFRQWFSVFY